MALLSKTSIFIDGNEVPSFKHLRLSQQIDAHHILEVVFRMETFEKQSTELGEKSKEFLGKTIAIQTGSISDRSELDILEFKGLITEIKIVKGANTASGEEIIVIAKSPTVLADDGPHYDSFNKKTLGSIVSQVVNNYQLDNQLDPRYTETIDYCVQHNESSFNFVSRLAAQYGEWFYYNGEKIIFGKPEIAETELKYNVDLIEFNLSLRPQSQKYDYYTNDYLTNTVEEHHIESNPAGGSAFGSFTFNRSGEIFNNQTNIWNNNNGSPGAKQQLKSKVKAQQDAIAINQVHLTGSSSNTGVKLGNIIRVEGEKFRVINIVHTTNRNGNYQNNFEAISGSFDAYPYTDINAFPKSLSQIGIVKENNDPKGLGRVRVQFPWQKKQKKLTCWIRVVSMQAGGSGGMYRIPHKNDEVIVGFENGNAEIPYISGSMFNAKSPPPAGSSDTNNHFTIWQVGMCFIKINEGDGSITFVDKNKSEITLEGNGDITMEATANINLIALKGEIKLSSKDITIDASNILNISGKVEANIKARNITAKAEQFMILRSGTLLKVESKKVIVTGETEAIVQGKKVNINGEGTTNVKGGTLNLN